VGDKKPTIRTLKTGEKAIHRPDGTMLLMPTNNVSDRLHSQQEDLSRAHDELTEKMRKNICAKQEAMRGGKRPVPHDKRSC
jgi:hypothetical protein